jgi:hypothetical protein
MPRSWHVRSIGCGAVLALVIFSGAMDQAVAQLPVARLNTVFPAGGKQGATFEVTITGTDLEQASKLLFTHAGITATPKTRDPNPFEQGPQVVPSTSSSRSTATCRPAGTRRARSANSASATPARFW